MEQPKLRANGFFLEGSEKAVLLIHGITGTPSEMGYLGRSLHKAGFTVLCNAFPRHCGSLKDLSRVTWQEIYASLVEDLEFLCKNYQKVFLCGLSMGAILAIHLAHNFPKKISGVTMLAPTIFFDGWGISRGRVFLPLVWHTPLKYHVHIRETWPYGLKNELLRAPFERFYKGAKASNGGSNQGTSFGSPFFPISCLHELHKINQIVKKELPKVKTPLQIIHAQEDDMVSVKNAHYLYESIGSEDKKVVILEDSYHMITIDKQKKKVAQETIDFFSRL